MGFVFLTLAILTGMLWSEQARGRYFTGDPKEWSAAPGLGDLRPADRGPAAHGLGRTRGRPAGHRRLRVGGLHLRLDDRCGAARSATALVIVVVGVSHRTAPLAVREALAFPRERMAEALAPPSRAKRASREAMMLSTCNRVEVYGRAEEARPGAAGRRLLADFHGRSLRDLEPHLYRLEGEDGGAPRLPGRGQPRLDGDRRAADPGPGEGGLRRSPRRRAPRARS